MKAFKRFLINFGQLFNKKKVRNRQISPFRRYLSEAEAEFLAEQVNRAFEMDVTSGQVQNVVEVLRYTEEKMIGRVAGDVDDYVLNYYMVSSSTHLSATSTPANGEIGILFGGGLLMMLHALKSIHSNHWVVAIDPLDGYYGQMVDPVSGLPVTLENVMENIKRFGFEMDRIRVVKARSESQEALQEVQSYPFASVWIDGDHSYEGIKRDWQNYSPFIIPGGYILIDNYHDGLFPGVDKFVDQDLLPNLTGWEVVTNLGRSILFKKRSDE